MLYLLGGPSRAGKSKLARRLLAERRIPYLPIDVLTMGLANGVPEFGLDPDVSGEIRGERLWPLLRAMAVNVLETDLTYLLEGDVLLPNYVAELIDRWGSKVRACFIGYTRIDPREKMQDIRQFGGEPNDWVRGHTDDQLLALIGEMVRFSRYLQEECARHGLVYVDGSHDFTAALDDAFTYLTQR